MLNQLFQWVKLDNIYDLDYGERILKSIIATKYAKKKFSILLMLLLTTVVKMQIVSITSYLISYNKYLDFITQISLSVFININTAVIYNIIAKYDNFFYKITNYLVINYSPENYRKWKRNVVCSFCIYLILILSIFEYSSKILICYIVQYLITFFIIDQIEHKKIYNLINNMRKPKRIIYGELNIINDFYESAKDTQDEFDDLDDFLTKNCKNDIKKEIVNKSENDSISSVESSGKVEFVIIDDHYKDKDKNI